MPLSLRFRKVPDATWQYDNSGSLSFSKWPNGRMVAVDDDWMVARKKRLQRNMTEGYY